MGNISLIIIIIIIIIIILIILIILIINFVCTITKCYNVTLSPDMK